eukprot:1361690-Rhodomonas_salina.1
MDTDADALDSQKLSANSSSGTVGGGAKPGNKNRRAHALAPLHLTHPVSIWGSPVILLPHNSLSLSLSLSPSRQLPCSPCENHVLFCNVQQRLFSTVRTTVPVSTPLYKY